MNVLSAEKSARDDSGIVLSLLAQRQPHHLASFKENQGNSLVIKALEIREQCTMELAIELLYTEKEYADT